MNCLKHRKEKPMKAEDRKKLQSIVNKYVTTSMLVGHEKAMQILKESTKKEVTGE